MEGPHRLSGTLQPHFPFQHGNVFIVFVDYKSNTCLWYKSHKKDMEVSCRSHSRDKDVPSFLYQSTGSKKHNDHSECFSWRQICLWGPMETLSQPAPFYRKDYGRIFALKDSSLKNPAVSCLGSPRSTPSTLLTTLELIPFFPNGRGMVGVANNEVSNLRG